MVVENDVISAVNSHVQVGDALDGLADHVQVLPAMVVGSPSKKSFKMFIQGLSDSQPRLKNIVGS